jgi:beta-1,4-mannosyl-glycoprotein beta-1,4-N-acetylglucosaminyltransferase
MIYDCFTFFNELDLLEIRLNILDGIVDKFVLVESTQTHQGKEKPLHFQNNKSRYEKFLPKIIHVIVDTFPENLSGNSWVLEHNQRNGILKGLKDAKPDDVVMISDLDEIPDPAKVMKHKDESGVKIMRMEMFYYFVNCRNESEGNYKWNGTVLIHRRDIKDAVQPFRENSMKLLAWFHAKPLHRLAWRIIFTIKGPHVKFIKDGGWHFSYLGGVEAIIKKLESFAHTEYNKAEFKDPKKITEALEKGEDIFGRGFRYKFVKVDSSYPEWMVKNISRFPHLVKN